MAFDFEKYDSNSQWIWIIVFEAINIYKTIELFVWVYIFTFLRLEILNFLIEKFFTRK